MRDYLGIRKVDPDDLEQHGILGMKWGRRRTEAQLATETKARAASGEKVTPTAKAKAAVKEETPGTRAMNGVETSAQRYARLASIAKTGGASSLDDTDLKFFNARTDALSKINKLNESNPGWLKTTTKTVLQNAAQRQMQAVADGVAGKFISGPILEGLKAEAGKPKTETPKTDAPKTETPKKSTMDPDSRKARPGR